MDLSKLFDTRNYNLFLSKLEAYMVSVKIPFHLLEAILQTSTSERKLDALSVIGTKIITGVPFNNWTVIFQHICMY